MLRRPPRSTLSSSSAASDVYKRQGLLLVPLTNDGASFTGQLIGAATIFVWVFGASLLTWAIIKAVIGLRVSKEEEYEGVDIAECGMEAYPEFKGGK